MRRSEFQIEDNAEIEPFIKNTEVGHLGIVDQEGYPRIVPLNYIYADGSVYFHGALDGERFELYQSNPKVTFSVDVPYSIIPSYWISKDYACPASTFFKSVHIRGSGEIVDDLPDKARFLQLFMEKYQSEGRYKEITIDDPLYKKALIEVTLYKIRAENVKAKFKLGQSLSDKMKRKIIDLLNERNIGLDRKTAEEMKKYL